ncbi:MAG TPA: radical SAM protein, partial [Clostridia bacterium]|nr:radical SAM protein [Clostridia bacterium]
MSAVHNPYLFEMPEAADHGDEGCPPENTKLVGIAKLAAEGESVRHGYNVEYFTMEARSILNRCTAARMPFTWTVNPYRGCEFACKYCYARYTHEYMEIRDNLEFERKIFIKQGASTSALSLVGEGMHNNVRRLVRRDLKKVKPGEEIAIGTATDPYQPAERRYGITRAILEELAQHRGLDIGFVTKSDLIVRDIDVLREIAEHNSLFVNFTVTTLDTQLARILEPRAPRPDLRLNALRELSQAGIDAGVICAPVLPGITDSVASLDAIVAETKRNGGKYIFANPLFLKPCSASVFMPFLEKEFPHLIEEYRKRYEKKAYLGDPYKRRISDLMRKLRDKHGIRYSFNKDRKQHVKEHPAAQQMGLFYELVASDEKIEPPLGAQRRKKSM